ncbi:MAG: enoyl-CoA hydratase/isomerase family protein [Dehalococcoidales bacterium]|nr:enoyl-CoA hydratase/isomerase family protein [Dehalococcoidales bacterium]
MKFEAVLYEVKENICTITMNRPEKRNALNYQLLNDIDAAFKAAEDDPEVRVVILAGAGSSFSSGYDIKDSPYLVLPETMETWTNTYALRTLRKIGERYQMIMYFSKPVVARVQGYCIAAGCYLQMCCDIAVAADNAILGHPATRPGGVTSMPLWVTLLGVRKAKEMLFMSKLINGKEAERIGLVNMSVPEDKLMEETWKVAKNLAEVPPDGIIISKEAINTHMRIQGIDAEFVYHRELNALGRVGRGRGPAANVDAARQRTKNQEQKG